MPRWVTIHTIPTAKAIEERVARREVDIGLVYAPVMEAGVVIEQLTNSCVVCAVPRLSPLSKRKLLGPEDLESVTVVATGPTTRIGAAIKETYSSHGLSMPIISVEVNSPQAACLMVAKGVGVGLVDLATVHQYPLPDVEFRPFEPHIKLSLCLIFPKDRPRSRLALRFAEDLRALFLTGVRSLRDLDRIVPRDDG